MRVLSKEIKRKGRLSLARMYLSAVDFKWCTLRLPPPLGTEAANSAKRGASPCADLTCAHHGRQDASRQDAQPARCKNRYVNEQRDTYYEIDLGV